MALAMSLLDCAERCERVLDALHASSDAWADRELKSTIILAIAAMQVAATSAILDGEAGADALRLVIRSAREAREALDRRDLDRDLIRHCATCCERATDLCVAALAASHGPA